MTTITRNTNTTMTMTTATAAAPSLPTAADLDAALRSAMAPTSLEVIDESAQHAGHSGAGTEGYGTHFRVRIASALFEGKSRVARHRLVYDSLQLFIAQGVHAIAIETL